MWRLCGRLSKNDWASDPSVSFILLMDNFEAKTSQQIPCILDVDLLRKTSTTHKNGEHTPKNAAWFIVWHIPEMDPKVPSGRTFKIWLRRTSSEYGSCWQMRRHGFTFRGISSHPAYRRHCLLMLEIWTGPQIRCLPASKRPLRKPPRLRAGIRKKMRKNTWRRWCARVD